MSRFLLPLMLLLVLALSGSAFAGGGDDKSKVATAAHRHVVVVPYDGESSVAPEKQKAKRYYVDYETFQRLWDRAKDKREEMAAEAAGDDGGKADAALGKQDFALTSALYRATVEDKRVAIEGRLALVTRGLAWQRVPLEFAGASVSELLIDGEPAAYEGGAILVEKPGRHEIVAHFEVPIAAAGNAAAVAKGKGKEKAAKDDDGGFSGLTRQPARWGIPAAAASMLAVTMAHPEAVPVINDGVPTVAAQDTAGLFTAALGQGTEVVLGQRLSTRGRGMTQPNVANIDSHLFVTSALERIEARYGMVFRDQEESHFSIRFDAGLTPVSFEIPNLLSWSLRDAEGDSGLRQLDFELTQPARDSLEVRLVAERLMEMGDGLGERSYPRFGAAALRLAQRQSLLRVDELNVRPEVAAGGMHSQIEFVSEGVDPAGFVPVASFGLSGAASDGGEVLNYAVTERPGERSAEVDYVYQVGADKVETVAQFQIRSPESSLTEITVGLPQGATIQAVRGNRLQEWWRNGDQLFARFSGATPDVTALLVYVSQEREGDAGNVAAGTARQVELSAMNLSGIDEVSGGGLVVAHATMDTTLRFAQSREIVREVDALSVASDFEVLPPLERKRGFTFSEPGVVATLSLQPVAPRYDITWVLLARSFESWVKLSAQVDVAVSRSAIDRLAFSLPADVPEVRVTSPEVREVRSEVVDGRRNYTVVFQRFVTDAVDFVIETEIGHAGQLSIAGLAFDDDSQSRGREERYVIVENASADRLKVNTAGMEKAVASMLPFEPENLTSPQIYRAGAEWTLELEVEDLKTTAGNDAVVMWSELTTAFRANGEEWLKVVYHLQNRSLQFMPVVLSEGSELISVSVAGESTRADQGPAENGRQAVLVPLIQTKPGQLAYDVELVMRSRSQVRKDGGAVSRLKRKMDDPDVLDIAVQRTLWHVSLPEGFELKDFEGNLEPVSDEELLLEKAESDLAEFEGLNVVAQSSEVERRSNYWAVDNGDLINMRLEKTLEVLDSKQKGRKVKGGDAELAKRGQQLRQRLEEQQVILTENRIQLPNFGTAAGGEKDGAQSGKEGGAKVDWSFNSGKLLDRNNKLAQDERAQFERLQDQMQINDNISLGNDFFRYGKPIQVDASGGAAQADRAKQSADKAAGQVGKLAEGKGGSEVESKLREISYAQIGHGGNQTAGNDVNGIALQGQVDVRANGGSGNGGFISLQSEQTNANADGGRIQIGGAMQGQNQAPAQPMTNKDDFDNARSSYYTTRSGNMSGGKGSTGKDAMPAGVVGPFAGPSSGPATPATAEPDPFAPDIPQPRVPMPSSERGAGQLLSAGVYQPTQGLKASGRRSVMVDFPDEGRRYHFRKIKDRAELSVVAAEPLELQRLGWLVLFALCVGALVAFDAGLRQTRQAK